MSGTAKALQGRLQRGEASVQSHCKENRPVFIGTASTAKPLQSGLACSSRGSYKDPGLQWWQ